MTRGPSSEIGHVCWSYDDPAEFRQYAAGDELFAVALRRAAPGRPGGTIVVRGDDLRFIDHRSLLNLERYAEERDVRAVLRTPYPVAGRLAGLLDRVRVEVAA